MVKYSLALEMLLQQNFCTLNIPELNKMYLYIKGNNQQIRVQNKSDLNNKI